MKVHELKTTYHLHIPPEKVLNAFWRDCFSLLDYNDFNLCALVIINSRVNLMHSDWIINAIMH